MPSTVKVPLPTAVKRQLEKAAEEEGLKLAALSRRLHLMYLKDPAAYNALFYELKQRERQQPAPEQRHGRKESRGL